MANLNFRNATLADTGALVALENQSFTDDRISRRSFRRFIDMPRDRVILAEDEGQLVGYSLVLMKANTRLARIYSIAVSPRMRGRGLGEAGDE
ncbi:MAG: GNAT family N-acetyltransferase, partial [Marinobacter sp.]